MKLARPYDIIIAALFIIILKTTKSSNLSVLKKNKSKDKVVRFDFSGNYNGGDKHTNKLKKLSKSE